MTPDVRGRLNYNCLTGVFTLRQSAGRKVAGAVAGYVKADGYRLIAIKGKYYYAHRLAWLYVHGEWPSHEIDHINGIRDDNRLSNLRPCTRSQNMRNVPGRKGWHWHSSKRKWQALIGVDGKSVFLGTFDREEDARAAYLAAAKRFHGEFAFIEKPKPAKQEALGL